MLKKCFIFYNFVSLVLAYLSHHCKCYFHFSHSFMKRPLVSSSLSNCVPINYYQHNSFSAKKKKKNPFHREFSVMLLSKSTTRYLQAVRRGKQFNTAQLPWQHDLIMLKAQMQALIGKHMNAYCNTDPDLFLRQTRKECESIEQVQENILITEVKYDHASCLWASQIISFSCDSLRNLKISFISFLIPGVMIVFVSFAENWKIFVTCEIRCHLPLGSF